MKNFKQYDEAFAKFYQTLYIKKLPIIAWDFQYLFLNDIKNSFQDLRRLNSIASKSKWGLNNWDIESRLNTEVIIITDTKLKIVYASHNIIKMNGYIEAEVLGKSPKMFHGEKTCLKTSGEIRQAVQSHLPFEKTVLNYKKNGEAYLCEIKSFPVFNTKGELSHFIAFEIAA